MHRAFRIFRNACAWPFYAIAWMLLSVATPLFYIGDLIDDDSTEITVADSAFSETRSSNLR